jgi:hypothetical protein
MNAVSSSPECHSASGLGLLSRARTLGVGHRRHRVRAVLEPGDQHLDAPAPGQLPPGGVDRAEVVRVGLIVRQHDPPKAMARQA